MKILCFDVTLVLDMTFIEFRVPSMPSRICIFTTVLIIIHNCR